MKLDGFVFFMGVWCGFVAVRYGERFDFLLSNFRRPVVRYNTAYLYVSYATDPKMFTRVPERCEYDEKVPPPAGFLL
ncbi:Uncharacterized protein FWK35_00014775 [Aphis craccivora]|uniref:Uncharacterized protein n=1 Tax=Aphis craccivora TaxID=307492 RepID=A0A6G0YNM0_APHCR|nr:Uncharacterized protein FWK35_00014775 [Aphis craccivora]